MIKSAKWLSVLAALMAFRPAFAAEVVVMTSFPATFYEEIRQAFEARHPEIPLKIMNRKTTAAMAALLDGAHPEVDLFWASAPDAFSILAGAGRLARTVPPQADPPMIGRFPIDDPQGFYGGFALSGYGMMWNEAYLAAHGLPAPERIDDLTRPIWFGHVVMSAPSRSGTTHLMVETLLQNQGWERGWATWLTLAGNLATLTARSFGVGAGVGKGRFGVGLSIDFLSRRRAGVRFAYPPDAAFLPASIALLKGGRNSTDAREFVAFLRSAEGQRLLMRPGIGRLPVDRAAYEAAPPDYPDPWAPREPLTFDAALSGRRYELVNLLFDEAVARQLSDLQKLWRALNAAEAKVATSDENAIRADLSAARAALTAVPVKATDLDAAWISDLRRVPWGVTPPPQQAARVAEWRSFFKANLAEAARRLESAEARLDAGSLP